jgi:hypothetical protein
MFNNGDFPGVVVLARRLHQSLPSLTAQTDKEGRQRSPLMNGVNMAVVALSLWPAALACQRVSKDATEKVLTDVMAATDACDHPPTRAYVLAHLCREYYRVICDPARGADAASQAQALASAHGLAHCSRSGGPAECTSPAPPDPRACLSR